MSASLLAGPSAILLTIAFCALAFAIGAGIFWAMEQIESSQPLPEPEMKWARAGNALIGLLAAGTLIRWWFLFAIVLLAGCAGAQPGGEAVADPPAARSLGGFAEVQEIQLRNGTPCAVVRSPRGIAIDCNWSAPR